MYRSNSSTLNWQFQTKHVLGKIYRALCALPFYKHALSRQLKRSIVESLVFPRFDYARAVFHDIDQTPKLKLQPDQNACVRFVIGNIAFRAQ